MALKGIGPEIVHHDRNQWIDLSEINIQIIIKIRPSLQTPREAPSRLSTLHFCPPAVATLSYSI